MPFDFTSNPDVPGEITHSIFKLFDIKTLAHARSVSTSWRELADDNHIWVSRLSNDFNVHIAKEDYHISSKVLYTALSFLKRLNRQRPYNQQYYFNEDAFLQMFADTLNNEHLVEDLSHMLKNLNPKTDKPVFDHFLFICIVLSMTHQNDSLQRLFSNMHSLEEKEKAKRVPIIFDFIIYSQNKTMINFFIKTFSCDLASVNNQVLRVGDLQFLNWFLENTKLSLNEIMQKDSSKKALVDLAGYADQVYIHTLLESMADGDKTKKFYSRVYRSAIMSGNLNVARYLMTCVGDNLSKPNLDTFLEYAAENITLEVITYLFESAPEHLRYSMTEAYEPMKALARILKFSAPGVTTYLLNQMDSDKIAWHAGHTPLLTDCAHRAKGFLSYAEFYTAQEDSRNDFIKTLISYLGYKPGWAKIIRQLIEKYEIPLTELAANPSYIGFDHGEIEPAHTTIEEIDDLLFITSNALDHNFIGELAYSNNLPVIKHLLENKVITITRDLIVQAAHAPSSETLHYLLTNKGDLTDLTGADVIAHAGSVANLNCCLENRCGQLSDINFNMVTNESDLPYIKQYPDMYILYYELLIHAFALANEAEDFSLEDIDWQSLLDTNLAILEALETTVPDSENPDSKWIASNSNLLQSFQRYAPKPGRDEKEPASYHVKETPNDDNLSLTARFSRYVRSIDAIRHDIAVHQTKVKIQTLIPLVEKVINVANSQLENKSEVRPGM